MQLPHPWPVVDSIMVVRRPVKARGIGSNPILPASSIRQGVKSLLSQGRVSSSNLLWSTKVR